MCMPEKGHSARIKTKTHVVYNLEVLVILKFWFTEFYPFFYLKLVNMNRVLTLYKYKETQADNEPMLVTLSVQWRTETWTCFGFLKSKSYESTE